jgi:hypothetical protein
MRTAQENLNELGHMVNARAGNPKMRSQTGFIHSRSPGKLDAIFADMLVGLGDAGKCADRDCEGIDGDGI